MDATVRTPVVTAALLLSLCLACFTALLPARAQLAPNNTDLPQEPNIDLDIDALLNNNQVFEESVNSSIWDIAAQPGRRLIQVPITVKPKSEETRLGTPSIKLRGGRFIAWRIVADETDNSNNRGGGRYSNEASYDPYSNPTSVGSLRNYGEEELGNIDQPNYNESSRSAQMGQQPTDDIPLITRDITVSPQGIIHWELDRAIPGGELKSGDTGYLLKLRPDRLNELRPEPPGRNTRSTSSSRSSRGIGGEAPTGRTTTTRRPSGNDAREAAARQRAEELEYREKLKEYNDLREHIRDLPDEFQAPLPSRLWAIYEVSDRMDELEFTGEPPLPWSIRQADIEALNNLTSRSRGGDNLTAEDFTVISQMTIMLANEHPLTERTVASSLSAAGMLGRSQQGDALYRLIARLLKSKDSQTVQITAAGLAANVPPSPATISLLRGAFDDLDPASKLMALGGLLTTEGNDPIAQRQMVDTANQIIADPNGPGVVHVLNQLVRALADNPDATKLVGASIKFDDLKPEALDNAIIYIAEAAGDSPLASEWMEHGLLGSTNPQTVKRTVELLATSTRGDGIVSRSTRSLVIATFGPGAPLSPTRQTAQMHRVGRIPINSTGHSIYRVLNAGDPELRSLGWQALRHFQVPSNNQRNNRSMPTMNPGEGEQTDRLKLILDAAFNETVTPPQLVSFLVNQEDTEPATEALVRIVVEGRGPAITRAARALVRSGRRIDQSLQQLTPEQRGSFASRLYEAVTGSSPMVAGLMRINDSRSRVVGWFAQQVTTTGLPQASEWASAMNGEDALLGLASNPDPELADAAVASLVASVGGDEVVARDLARQMSNATDRSPSGLGDIWSEAKQEIYAGKLQSAAGSYRLIINVRGNNNSNTGYDAPGGYDYGGYDGEFEGEYGGGLGGYGPDPSTELASVAALPLIKSINLALIELRADGTSIELASGTLTLSASDQRLAIVMQDPKELNDFGNNEVSDLPIENLNSPIELLPQPGNVWRGAASLGDGRSIEVIFDPQ